jgi:hypothetical protein
MNIIESIQFEKTDGAKVDVGRSAMLDETRVDVGRSAMLGCSLMVWTRIYVALHTTQWSALLNILCKFQFS